MRKSCRSGLVKAATCAVLVVLALTPGKAVEAQAKRLITRAVDESQQVRLKGSVPAQLRLAKDLGEVERSQPAGRLLLVLKRPDEQEAALQSFLLQAHQQTSAAFHKWLKAGEFGAQFGAADADLEQLKGWLQAHGLTVAKVSAGKTAIEFSGTIGQVSDAFHTSIHEYSVKNAATGEVERHFANAVEPSVPAAFGGVVAGVSQLNDFRPQPQIKVMGRAKYNVKTHGVTPEWTYGYGAGYAPYYILAPEDFSTEYDVKPVYAAGITGTGQTIGIINDSNIDLGLVNAYRKLFGLSVNPTQVVIDGNDPGINGDAGEAYLDVENAGSIAPDATVKLYVAGSVGLLGEGGLGFSLARAVDDDVAPVLSLSFGICEAALGTAGNQYYNSLWEQAAAQGQTVMVATGDSGSIGFGCGIGLGLNGLGSTPWNVAVGGTDAYYSDYASGAASITSYWGGSNDANLGSLQKKFMEQPWDGTQFGLNSIEYDPVMDQPGDGGAGGGGPSTCVVVGGVSSLTGLPICVSGYAKPAWQIAPGVPKDSVRDVPDVSLFASNGYNGTFWPMCAEEGDCTVVDPSVGEVYVTGVGGTSASSPAMAGIMALVNQKYGPQGQADFTLYPLAVQFPAVFNDVTVGSNNEPCSAGEVGITFGCALDPDGDGYYSYQGYSAGPGYDLATGLGSIDVNQLITNWGSVTFKSTATTLSVTPATAIHGQAVTASVAVTGSGTPGGAVALVDNAPLANQAGLGTLELSAGKAEASVTTLPGGTYTVVAQYAGDGVNAASKSLPVTVTVSAEASSLELEPVYLNATSFDSAPITAGLSVPYGDGVLLDVMVNDAAGQQDGIATGTVTFTDGTTTLGTANVSAAGVAEFNGSLLGVGSHTIAASYSGDASYKASTSSSLTFTIAAAPTFAAIYPDFAAGYNPDGSVVYYVGASPNMTALVGAYLVADGVPPTGTVTFQLGNGTPVSVQLVTGETLEFGTYSVLASAASEVLKNLPLGTQTLTVTYGGDAHYAAASAMQVIEVVAPVGLLPSTTTFVVTSPASLTNVSPATVISATVTVTGAGSVAPTGTVTPTLGNVDAFYPIGLTAGAGAVSTATFQARAADFLPGANTLSMNYSGDAVYQPSSSSSVVVVNDATDFTIQSQTTNLSLTSGGTGMATISLASMNGYNGAVGVTCTTVSQLSCSVGSASVNLNGFATTTVTINSTATTAAVQGDEGSGRLGMGLSGTVLACLLCFMLPRRRRVGRMLCGVVAIAMLVGGISGCGGTTKGVTKTPPPPPPAVANTYTVVVTGTGANGLVHNTVITVVVE